MAQALKSRRSGIETMDGLLAGIITQARIAAGLTQVDLAGLLERPQSFVCKIEARTRRVGAVELVLIGRALGRSAGDMLAELPSAPAARVRRARKAPAASPMTGGGVTTPIDRIPMGGLEAVQEGRPPTAPTRPIARSAAGRSRRGAAGPS